MGGVGEIRGLVVGYRVVSIAHTDNMSDHTCFIVPSFLAWGGGSRGNIEL